MDDARTWGQIAAANAASDVYAMGGRPLFALNVVAWPRDRLSLELLGDALLGAEEVAQRGGWIIAGGHTVDGEEPLLGQAVIGEAHPDRLLTNAGARVGEVVVLTKGLGTGLLATAVKRLDASAISNGGQLHVAYAAAVASMTLLNAQAAEAALAVGASAVTDVTGFGLLGHLSRLATESAVSIRLEADAIPRLSGAEALLDAGFVPGGTHRNLDHVSRVVNATHKDWDRLRLLLADPQTSGGLLFTTGRVGAESAVQELRGSGHQAEIIGVVTEDQPGSITVV